jgi:hypothetical protein
LGERPIARDKEHAPMLSSPGAKGSKGGALALERQAVVCDAQRDLVFARA